MNLVISCEDKRLFAVYIHYANPKRGLQGQPLTVAYITPGAEDLLTKEKRYDIEMALVTWEIYSQVMVPYFSFCHFGRGHGVIVYQH
ncbi:hypothetical protein GCM10011328_34230 [Hafnia psychrotolerans]|uniref:Transposase n=1 Tax=Hafnia psychrotolerans TaxID=1477018 RepID=A0ABQ1H1Y2_9GAMM|nr:hypothetical protein GCM10011328_34230 [Hafnia psychrotolerans]